MNDKPNCEWSRYREVCPECGKPFVAQDKWGEFCCFSNCSWQHWDFKEGNNENTTENS